MSRQGDPRRTRAWRKLRDQVVVEEPVCWLGLPCCTRWATTADHVIPVSHRPDLGMDRANVTKAGVITDGPFGEAKEVVGGYWFVTAASLRAAADLLSDSPTIPCGLHYEVRPLDPEVCTASDITNETPPA